MRLNTSNQPMKLSQRWGKSLVNKYKRNREGRELTAIEFVRAVGAVIAVVALAVEVDAADAVAAAEFVQVTRRYVGVEGAVLLVGAVAAVEESIAFLLRRDADARRAFEIRALAVTEHCKPINSHRYYYHTSPTNHQHSSFHSNQFRATYQRQPSTSQLQ